MNKIGEDSEPRTAIIIATIALIVAGIVLGGAGKIFDKEIFPIGNLIPGFGGVNASNGQLSVVGVSLTNPHGASDLLYYTGTSWKNYDSSKSLQIGNQEFSSDEIKKELVEFYYYTARKGKDTFQYSANDAIELYVLKDRGSYFDFNGFFNLDGRFKSGKVGDEKSLPAIAISFDDKVTRQGSQGVSADNLRAITEYRDQILAGHICEKFIQIGSKSYHVRKESAFGTVYLFVDLNNPATGQESYSSCDDAVSAKSFDWTSQNQLDIEFLYSGNRHHYTWNNGVWVYNGGPTESDYFKNLFVNHAGAKSNFYGGLSIIVDALASKRTVVLVGSKASSIKFNILSSDGHLISSISTSGLLDGEGRISGSVQSVVDSVVKAYNDASKEPGYVVIISSNDPSTDGTVMFGSNPLPIKINPPSIFAGKVNSAGALVSSVVGEVDSSRTIRIDLNKVNSLVSQGDLESATADHLKRLDGKSLDDLTYVIR